MVQQQGFFDPPAEFIAEVQQSVADAASGAIAELDGLFRALVSEAVPSARELLVDPVNEFFAVGREAVEGLRILSLEPLAEAANRALNELAVGFFPVQRLNG